MMDYDRWLQEPYQHQDQKDIEASAERIYKSYNRKELFPEFLEIFGGEIESDHPICSAIVQRDYEAIGGLLLEAFERHLSDCADYDAERLSGWRE